MEARRWLYEQVGTKEMEMHDMEGYDELIQKIVTNLPPELIIAAFTPEQRLAGLSPEQVLATLKPEQRLAGLSRDQAVLALPDEILRALSDEYLSTFPASTRAVIRDRIGR